MCVRVCVCVCERVCVCDSSTYGSLYAVPVIQRKAVEYAEEKTIDRGR